VERDRCGWLGRRRDVLRGCEVVSNRRFFDMVQLAWGGAGVLGEKLLKDLRRLMRGRGREAAKLNSTEFSVSQTFDFYHHRSSKIKTAPVLNSIPQYVRWSCLGGRPFSTRLMSGLSLIAVLEILISIPFRFLTTLISCPLL
jgi:hypothetical protein